MAERCFFLLGKKGTNSKSVLCLVEFVGMSLHRGSMSDFERLPVQIRRLKQEPGSRRNRVRPEKPDITTYGPVFWWGYRLLVGFEGNPKEHQPFWGPLKKTHPSAHITFFDKNVESRAPNVSQRFGLGLAHYQSALAPPWVFVVADL